MDALLDAFGDLSTTTRALEYKISSVDTVYNALRTFHNVLAKSTQVYKDSLWTIHQSELERIRVIIKNYIVNNKNLNSIYDKVFINILSSRQSQTTIIFTKFIKGITYFKDELYTADTVYHRPQSCGAYKSIRGCNALHASNKLNKKQRERSYLCYLERLIWDAIYKFNTPHIPGTFDEEITQDNAHEDRIITTKKEFQSCYRDCDLLVTVECNPQPFKLTIQHTHKGKVKLTETYNRDVLHDRFGSWEYDIVVICKRNSLQRDYTKFQTFYKKSKWIPLPESNKARSLLTITSVNTSSTDTPKLPKTV